METGIWHVEQRIQSATLMLHHNIKNSDVERDIKKMVEEQEKKVQIAETREIEIEKVAGKKNQHGKKK